MPVVITFACVKQAQTFIRREKVSKGELVADNGAELTLLPYLQANIEDYDVVSVEEVAEVK